MAKNEAVQNQKVFITLDNFVLMQNHYRTLVENVNAATTIAYREARFAMLRGYEMALEDTGLPYVKLAVKPFVATANVS